MALPGLISDALLGDLMAAGQADLVVGLATLNDADTVATVVDAILEAFSTTLLRPRTVLIAVDAGSKDDTQEIVRGSAQTDRGRPFRHPLRTVHRIASTFYGPPHRATALRVLLAAAELLGARALVLVDPADVTLRPEEVASLALGVMNDGYDLIKPVLPRSQADGPLVTQLVRPLVRSLWRAQVAEPLATPFACSKQLVIEASRRGPWTVSPAELSLELWLTLTAVSSSSKYKVAQTYVQQRPPGGTRRAPLLDVFVEVVATLFGFAPAHAPDGALLEPALLGQPPGVSPTPVAPPSMETAHEAFAAGRQALEPLWREILTPETARQVLGSPTLEAGLAANLWVAAVYEFIDAANRRQMPLSQLARALLPLYYGRLVAFAREDANGQLDSLAGEFMAQRSREVKHA